MKKKSKASSGSRFQQKLTLVTAPIPFVFQINPVFDDKFELY